MLELLHKQNKFTSKNFLMKSTFLGSMLVLCALCFGCALQAQAPDTAAQRYAADAMYLTRGGGTIQFAKSGQIRKPIGWFAQRLAPTFREAPRDAQSMFLTAVRERRGMTAALGLSYSVTFGGMAWSTVGIVRQDEQQVRNGLAAMWIGALVPLLVTVPLSAAQHNHLQEAMWLRNRGLVSADSTLLRRYNREVILPRQRFFKGYTHQINGVEHKDGIFYQHIAKRLGTKPTTAKYLQKARREAAVGFAFNIIGQGLLWSGIFSRPPVNKVYPNYDDYLRRVRRSRALNLGGVACISLGGSINLSARRHVDKAIYHYNREVIID